MKQEVKRITSICLIIFLYFPLMVLKGIYHYVFFSGVLTKWKIRGKFIGWEVKKPAYWVKVSFLGLGNTVARPCRSVSANRRGGFHVRPAVGLIQSLGSRQILLGFWEEPGTCKWLPLRTDVNKLYKIWTYWLTARSTFGYPVGKREKLLHQLQLRQDPNRVLRHSLDVLLGLAA